MKLQTLLFRNLLVYISIGLFCVPQAYAQCATGSCGTATSSGSRPTNESGGSNPACSNAPLRFTRYNAGPYVYSKTPEELAQIPIYDPSDCAGDRLPIKQGFCLDSCNTAWTRNAAIDIKRDFFTYFQTCNLLALGTAIVAAGLLANTGADRTISRIWQEDITSSKSNSFFKFFNHIGGLSYYYFPVYLAAVGLGAMQDCSLTGNVLYHWGYRSLRTIILTTIQQIPLAYLIGSGRPNQNQPSKWQPFKYKTGVSGHAVFGAVPFLTAAMMTDPPLFRYSLYALSTLPGLARINNNKHYFSQVLLGWSLAFLSARAVYRSDQLRQSGLQVSFVPKLDGAMMLARYEF